MSRVYELMIKEKERQENGIELIASENYISDDIRNALMSVFTDKYAEGYPGKRYYGGCQVVDELETYCQEKWQEVFDTNYHVNVQPHSGTQANMAAFAAVLKPGDKILSLDLNSGGHLSHGSPVSFSGKTYYICHYGLDERGYIDYENLEKMIRFHRPQLILAGASAYSREIQFQRIRDIISKCTSFDLDDQDPCCPYFMVDMSHVAGLVAAGDHQTPFGLADIITTTTHKTLRGPRGGLIFCKEYLSKKIDSAVFPYAQGGPHMNVIAAKAFCAEEALTPEFRNYIHKVCFNAREMAEEFIRIGYKVVTGGTDNHMFLLDLSRTHPHVTGKMAQDKLDEYLITVNKKMVPGDKRKPSETSGIRIGTAAMTTRGWMSRQFVDCARYIGITLDKLEEKARESNNFYNERS